MGVREMLARLDSREISEWMELWRQEGWGDFRADLRNGITSSVIANVNRREGTDPYRPQDFMPFAPQRKKVNADALLDDDPETQARLIKAMVFGIVDQAPSK